MIKPQYISTLELAKFLGISPVAVFKRIKKGKIKAIKIGRSYAIPESYVREHFPTFPLTIADEGEYLSVMEAAQILGLSRIAVFKRIQSGKLPAKKVGRHYVIQKDHVTKEPVKKFIPVPVEKDYISVPELAQILGLSRITVFNKIKRGAIKAKKVGRHYAIAREDVLLLKKEDGRGKKEEIAKGERLRVKGEKQGESVILSEAKDLKEDSSSAISRSAENAHLRITGEEIKKKEDYVSLIEAGKIIGISRVAVYKKVKKGQIKAIRIGRSYAIEKKGLEPILLKEQRSI